MFTAPYGEPPAVVQHVLSSNSIWDPNKLANPPVITTAGTTSIGSPTRWFLADGTEIPGPVQPALQDPFHINWIPQPQQPATDFQEAMRLHYEQIVKAVGIPPEMLQPQKVEEPEEEAKPVEKKYGRVVEP